MREVPGIEPETQQWFELLQGLNLLHHQGTSIVHCLTEMSICTNWSTIAHLHVHKLVLWAESQPPNIMCRSPHPQDLRMWLRLEMGSFKRGWSSSEATRVAPDPTRLWSLEEEIRTHTHTDNTVRTQGRDSHRHVQERVLRRDQPCPPLGLQDWGTSRLFVCFHSSD